MTTSASLDDEAIRRVGRNALLILAVFALGTLGLTRSFWQVAAVLASGALVLLSFRSLVSLSSSLAGGANTAMTPLQGLFLLARYGLLGLGLYAIVQMPGVGPIPIVVGLSVLVIAILLEAIHQLSRGTGGRA